MSICLPGQLRSASIVAVWSALIVVWTHVCPGAWGDIQFPVPLRQAPITVRAERAQKWQEGQYEVWHLRDGCEIQQGDMRAYSSSAILWVERQEPYSGQTSRVIAYLEGQVDVRHKSAGTKTLDRNWFGRFLTETHVHLNVLVEGLQPTVKPAIYRRARQAWDQQSQRSEVQLAQFTTPVEDLPLGNERVSIGGIRIDKRYNQGFQFVKVPGSDGRAHVGTDVVVTIENVQIDGYGSLGNIQVAADRLVYWGPNPRILTGGAEEEIPIELYIEGNVEFRQGDRLIYADRMYYNVTGEYGVVLGAEVFTPIDDYQGVVRLKADVLQQLNRQFFQAYGAAVTSSRLGVPQYWIQSQNITFEDQTAPRTDAVTGAPLLDARTQEVAQEHNITVTSRNNFLYAGGIPFFYWPVIATDLTKPTYYIDEFKIKNDRVFGTQVLFDWDVFQLLGIRNRPPDTEWTISTDYLSDRGFGLGTYAKYQWDTFLGLPSPSRGFVDAWGLNDGGLDDLGANRRGLVPEEDFRGRILARHRQYLPGDIQFLSELGWVSDRNFLEQYFEKEWDEQKDQVTGFNIYRLRDNRMFRIQGQSQLNEFFTQTDWARVDHYLTGQSLLFGRLTWHEHSHIAHARLNPATAPLDPQDAAGWMPLPGETRSDGIRAVSRQEIDLPLQFGPVKFIPYALGEIGYWESDTMNEDVTRAYGQMGVRASLPFWRADPTVRNSLLNLNGLAQKYVFETDFFYADANENLDRFPRYDPLDDDAQEHFRRRFSYGPQFDDRSYAFRSNLQRWVSAPVPEIADDMTAVRLGFTGRWQTKRGMAGQERVVDFVTLEMDGTLFPNADRDNFGQELGLLEYDLRWHVGDRVTVLSDGYSDLFSNGLRTFSLGGIISRPEVGRLYVGFRTIEGPITSNVLSASLSYRMSEKWIADLGTAVDLGPAGNIGQNVGVTRIGESMLVRIGFYVDESRDNVGVQFAIEPRFLPGRRLGKVGGVQIPPAGLMGLE